MTKCQFLFIRSESSETDRLLLTQEKVKHVS